MAGSAATSASDASRPMRSADAGSPSGPARLIRTVVSELGSPALLLGQLVRTAVREPRGYWGEVRDESYHLIRRVFVPAVITLLGYGMLLAAFLVPVLMRLGAEARTGSFGVGITIREIAPILNAVIMAGIIGTATTADIGARKIREELDALRVLGQDPIRMLILPRVIAMTLVTFVMSAVGIVIQLGEIAAVSVVLGGVSPGVFLPSLYSAMTVYEVGTSVAKSLVFGLLIGIICASKGLTTKSGAEGLGRAVNQAVVLCILAIFVVDAVMSIIPAGAIPEFSVNR